MCVCVGMCIFVLNMYIHIAVFSYIIYSQVHLGRCIYILLCPHTSFAHNLCTCICIYIGNNVYIGNSIYIGSNTYIIHNIPYMNLCTCMCTYIHTYIHTDTHTRTRTCTLTHAYIPKYIHTYIHTDRHTHTHTSMHTYTYTYLNTYIHTYIRTYIGNNIYIGNNTYIILSIRNTFVCGCDYNAAALARGRRISPSDKCMGRRARAVDCCNGCAHSRARWYIILYPVHDFLPCE